MTRKKSNKGNPSANPSTEDGTAESATPRKRRVRVSIEPRAYMMREDDSLPEWAEKPFWDEADPQESQEERAERISQAIEVTFERDKILTKTNGTGYARADFFAAGLLCSEKLCKYSYDSVQYYDIDELKTLTLGFVDKDEPVGTGEETDTKEELLKAYRSLTISNLKTGIATCHHHRHGSKPTVFLGYGRCGHVGNRGDNFGVGRDADAPMDHQKRPLHYTRIPVFSLDGKVCRNRHIFDDVTETVKIACSTQDALTISRSLDGRKKNSVSGSEPQQITDCLEVKGQSSNEATQLPSKGSQAQTRKRTSAMAGSIDKARTDKARRVEQAKSEGPQPQIMESNDTESETNNDAIQQSVMDGQVQPYGHTDPPSRAVDLPSIASILDDTLPSKDWRLFHDGFLANADQYKQVTSALKGDKNWSCWLCQKSLGDVPAGATGAEKTEWLRSTKYAQDTDRFAKYGTHICPSNRECQEKRNIFMTQQGCTKIDCDNTNCVSRFTSVNNDDQGQGFTIQDETNTYRYCSPLCQAYMSVRLTSRDDYDEEDLEFEDRDPSESLRRARYGEEQSQIFSSGTGNAWKAINN